MVANALAAKLLLQLRQEVSMAQQAGVNVTALSKTLKKLTSYAFGAPLFCGKALQATLQEHDLDGQINTVLTAGDASPLFFTLCGELFSPGAAAEPPFRHRPLEATAQPRRSASALSDDSDLAHDPICHQTSLDFNSEECTQQQRVPVGPSDFSLDATQVHSKGFGIIQAWAAAVADEVKALAEGARPAASHEGAFATAPLPTRAVLLRSTAGPNTMLDRTSPELCHSLSSSHLSPPSQLQKQPSTSGTATEHRTSVPRRIEDPKRQPLRSQSSNEMHVGSPNKPTSPLHVKTRHSGAGQSVSPRSGPVSILACPSSPPSASVSVRSSSSRQLTSSSSLRGNSSPSPLAPMGTKVSGNAQQQQSHSGSPALVSVFSNGGVGSKHSSHKNIRAAHPQSKAQSVSSDSSSHQAASGRGASAAKGSTSWNAALTHLLAAQRGIAEALYVPVGHFWMLSVASDTVSSAVGRLRCERGHKGLSELDGSCVRESMLSWLAADNPQLFLRWELELEELQPFVMEAFAWSSFGVCINHHGAVVERAHLMKSERSGC
ncbi:MAG: hypothetical protein WDW36_002710 [Sanguina aurantia]